MFQVNDYIIYGENGVCKIDDICTPPIDGVDKNIKYYILHPVYAKGRTIYTPVDNDKVVMRRLLSAVEAMELINRIPTIGVINIANEKYLEESYRNAMHKYDCGDWIKMIKTLYIRREERIAEGKKVSSTDLKYLHMAEEYLYGELSISLGISKDDMESFISQKMKEIEW